MNTAFDLLAGDEYAVMSTVIRISSVGALITGAEWLSLAHQFAKNALYGWPVRETAVGFPFYRVTRKPLRALYKHPNVLLLPVLQTIAAAVLILFGENSEVLTIGTWIVAASYLLMSFRGAMGYTGADHMLKMTFCAGALTLTAGSSFCIKCGLIFIAAQTVLAYATPGLLRAARRSWYNGFSLLLILRQRTFGVRWLWELVSRYRWLAAGLSTSVVIFEVGFGFSLLLPSPTVPLFLIAGVVFHSVNALVMGLNTFLWSFIGAYPAVFWVSVQLSSKLYTA